MPPFILQAQRYPQVNLALSARHDFFLARIFPDRTAASIVLLPERGDKKALRLGVVPVALQCETGGALPRALPSLIERNTVCAKKLGGRKSIRGGRAVERERESSFRMVASTYRYRASPSRKDEPRTQNFDANLPTPGSNSRKQTSEHRDFAAESPDAEAASRDGGTTSGQMMQSSRTQPFIAGKRSRSPGTACHSPRTLEHLPGHRLCIPGFRLDVPVERLRVPGLSL